MWCMRNLFNEKFFKLFEKTKTDLFIKWNQNIKQNNFIKNKVKQCKSEL